MFLVRLSYILCFLKVEHKSLVNMVFKLGDWIDHKNVLLDMALQYHEHKNIQEDRLIFHINWLIHPYQVSSSDQLKLKLIRLFCFNIILHFYTIKLQLNCLIFDKATYYLQDTNIHLDIKLDINLKDSKNLLDKVLTNFLILKHILSKFNLVDKF